MCENAYYFELNFICLALLSWTIIKTNDNIDRQTKNIIFLRVAYSNSILILIDIIWKFIEGKQNAFSFYTNNVINIIYLSATGFVSYNWLAFILCNHLQNKKTSFLQLFLFHIPLIVLICCAISSPWTHILFYIDPVTNIYHRGAFHFIQEIVAYGYFIVACLCLFIFSLQKKTNIYPTKHQTLAISAIIPLLAAIISNFFPGVEIIWQATTISLLVAFSDMLSEQISVDALTGLNNRHTFNTFMDSLTSMNHDDKGIYLFMIDINDFKLINDKYGHPEGDKALTMTAHVLREVFSNKEAFIARFGGDEFSIIYYCNSDSEAEEIRRKLYDTFKTSNTNSDRKYAITVSAGYARYIKEDEKTISHLLKRADEELYKEKHKVHSSYSRR